MPCRTASRVALLVCINPIVIVNSADVDVRRCIYYDRRVRESVATWLVTLCTEAQALYSHTRDKRAMYVEVQSVNSRHPAAPEPRPPSPCLRCCVIRHGIDYSLRRARLLRTVCSNSSNLTAVGALIGRNSHVSE